MFAIQLASHLALQYPIPKSYSISKYIIDRLNNLLVALPAVKRNQLFVPSLKCLVRIGEAFPPLRQDITELILKINKVATSQQDKSSLVTGKWVLLVSSCFFIKLNIASFIWTLIFRKILTRNGSRLCPQPDSFTGIYFIEQNQVFQISRKIKIKESLSKKWQSQGKDVHLAEVSFGLLKIVQMVKIVCCKKMSSELDSRFPHLFWV